MERAAHDDVSSRASDVYRGEFRSDQIRAPSRYGAVLCLCILLAANRADVGVESACCRLLRREVLLRYEDVCAGVTEVAGVIRSRDGVLFASVQSWYAV